MESKPDLYTLQTIDISYTESCGRLQGDKTNLQATVNSIVEEITRRLYYTNKITVTVVETCTWLEYSLSV